MANEFIARKGIIVLENGVKVTGSLQVNGDITASGDAVAVHFRGSGQFLTNVAADSVQFDNVLNKPTLVSSSAQISYTGITNVPAGIVSSSEQVTTLLPAGTVSASSQVSYTGLSNIPAGIISSSTQVVAALPAGTVSASSQVDHDATTNFVANEHIDHSTVAVSAGDGLGGGGYITASLTVTLDTGSAHFTGGTRKTITSSNTTGASGIDLSYNQTTGNISASLVNSSVTVNGQSISLGGSGTVTANTTNALTLGAGLTGTSFNGSAAVTTAVDTGSTHFVDGVVKGLPAGTVSSSTQVVAALPAGTVSASSQVVASDITGIGNYAQLTGSNTFTAVNTFSNTTNSTAFNNGAVVIDGGLGVAKDVTISGSLTVEGLLTVVSMSTQYVTSSQYTVGTSRIIVNDDDLVRFAGLSVIDSGSTYGTGSLLWDSLNNRWIIEADDSNYESAVLILGPQHTGTLGDEPLIVDYRVPVGFGNHHIDNRVESSSIRVDFPSKLTHIEAGLYVTGAITSSVGFSGNGAGLTNVAASSVDYTNITNKPTLVSASSQIDHDATTNFVANEHIDHSTVTVSATNGLSGGGTITSSFSVTLDTGSAHFAEGVVKGLPAGTVSASSQVSYTGLSNIPAGIVSSSAQFNNLSSPFTGSFTGSFTGNGSGLTGIASTLQAITDGGASTTNQVTLAGGAIIHGVLFTSSSTTGIAGPVSNQVVASFLTGSHDAAHFDYVVKDGTNFRTGTVMAVWDTTTGIEFTDTSTNDIGNTLGVTFAVDTNGGNVRLKTSATTGTWTVKTAIRAL